MSQSSLTIDLPSALRHRLRFRSDPLDVLARRLVDTADRVGHDDRFINITPEIRDDPRKYAEARDRAIKEGKQLRFRSGLLR